MNCLRGIAITMAGLAAGGAFAATATAPKKISVKARGAKTNPKPLLAKNTESAAPDKADMISSSAASAVSAANPSNPSGNGINAGTSTASGIVVKKSSFADKVKLGVLVEFFGPSITDPFSGNQPDQATGYSQSSDTSQELDTTLIIGYRFSNNVTLTLNPMFASYGHPSDNSKNGKLFAFSEDYSSIRLSFGKFAKVGKLTWNGDFRFYPGMGDSGRSTPVYLRSGQNLMYSVTPKITLAAYNTLRYYRRTDSFKAAKPTAFDLRATITPAFEYQISDGFLGSFSYNMDIRREIASGDIVDAPAAAGPYFEIGAIVDASKVVNINPYIDIYKNSANIEAWQFGANVNFNIL